MAVTQTEKGPGLIEVESLRERICTLDGLLAACAVDLDEWRVRDHVINKWEVGAKGPDGEIVVEPLFQVKAWLIRRKPMDDWPVIRPITLAKSHYTPRKVRRGAVKTVLVLPDPQFGFYRDLRTGALEPFHDMRALDVAVQLAYHLRPHYIVLLGDMLDLPDWSDKFARSPSFEQTTQPAIVAAAWWLKRLREAVPSAVMVLLEGNHDKRMELAIINHLKAAYQLRPADQLDLPPALSVPRLLALHQLGVQYRGAYPDGEFWVHDNFVLVHGDVVRGAAGKTTAALVKEYDVDVLTGHIHRLERASRTRRDGRIVTAFGAGCLCRLDGAVPGSKKRQNWQQGLAVAHVAVEDGAAVPATHVQLCEIREGRLMLGRNVFEGEDRTEEMAADTGWRFT